MRFIFLFAILVASLALGSFAEAGPLRRSRNGDLRDAGSCGPGGCAGGKVVTTPVRGLLKILPRNK